MTSSYEMYNFTANWSISSLIQWNHQNQIEVCRNTEIFFKPTELTEPTEPTEPTELMELTEPTELKELTELN